MKNSGKCPKCNSTKIFIKKGFKHGTSSGAIMLGASSFSNAKVDRYICSECGYIEHWLQDIENLKKYM